MVSNRSSMRAKSAASSGVASRTVIIAIRQAPLPRPYWSQRQRIGKSPPCLFNSLPIYRRERDAPGCVNIKAIGATVATPGLVLQRVRRELGGQAAADELRRQAQRLARCLVFEGGDELLGQAQTWIARKHLATQVWRNILGAPTR